MGWFWADTASSSKPVALQSLVDSNTSHPPGCPMHLISHDAPQALSQTNPSSPFKTPCPVKLSEECSSRVPAAKSTLSKLNPLNYMPSNLSQERATQQTVDLPLERELSSIPRGDAESNWEYPSPQQMYNAMLRKGYDDTPQDAVESMVAVHNFLNEGAWAEIVEWERIFSRGLSHGWQECVAGRAGLSTGGNDALKPKLLRFQGRPNEMTPKAKMFQALGQIYPSKFGGEPPFDRHDWYVLRHRGAAPSEEVRYVIDYYSGPPEPTGEPVFYLDVRPAVDTPSAAIERLFRWSGDVWYRASGASVREQASR